MERQALAVKYRPAKFEDVCEQASTITILQNQLETETFKHAYLFTGPAGCGKTTCARIFAKEINKGQGNALEMDAASNSGVDDVRKIIQQAQTQSIDSEFKVFIIDECHAISNTGWQAFLKLIEEPPAKSIFIFCTTDPQKIPATILSRVQRFSFTRITNTAIYENLVRIANFEQIELTDELSDALKFIATLSEGGMRDAITLMDKCLSYTEQLTVDVVADVLGYVSYAELFSFIQMLLTRDTQSAINFVEAIYLDGVDMKQFINQLYKAVLDGLVLMLTDKIEFTQFPQSVVPDELFTEVNDELLVELLESLSNLRSELKWVTTTKSEVEAWIVLLQL